MEKSVDDAVRGLRLPAGRGAVGRFAAPGRFRWAGPQAGGAAGGRGKVGAEKLERGGARRLLEGALKHTVARSAASEGRRVWPGHTAAQPQRPSDLEDRRSGRPRRG